MNNDSKIERGQIERQRERERVREPDTFGSTLRL